MSTATCACNAVRISICHCLECRKSSGSTHGLNLVVPGAGFLVKGSPSSFTYEASSGNNVTRYFCRRCGVNLYSDGAGAPGVKFVKAGAVDDPLVLNECRPDTEFFVSRRAAWQEGISGVEQRDTM
ncbi:hypothetical protein N7471_000207 [Penicillium samsonianum]|uniref:uncharacterized protein n=1 Tax=Penicillium samsonianum TaxID=1882272 RepID=UPI002547C5A0|nr:uncharacterized protein N7471_000207 [Penicillium samsonianum]KAJ6149008.1 hypothetical protein N7471_000207 [Penicillium samsonianum]